MNKLIVYIFVLTALSACATAGQTNLLDFNTKFNESIPTSPKYRIDFAGLNRYQIVVYQGSPLLSERTTRASFLTRAGLIAMEAECLKKNSVLADYSLKDQVDSWGYINVLGYFSCKPLPLPVQPEKPQPKVPQIEI